MCGHRLGGKGVQKPNGLALNGGNAEAKWAHTQQEGREDKKPKWAWSDWMGGGNGVQTGGLYIHSRDSQ
jgi:hypothetical protein